MVKFNITISGVRYNLEFDNTQEALEFIQNYVVWDELRLKPISFSASVQEQDKNDN